MNKPYIYILISAVLFGAVPIFARLLQNLGLTSYESSLFPFLLAVILLAPLAVIRRKQIISKEFLKDFSIFGLISAATILLLFASIALGTPIAFASLLLIIQFVYLIILGRIFLNEKITSNKIISAVFGFIGLLLLFKAWATISNQWIGIILAFLSGVACSIMLLYAKVVSVKNYKAIDITIGFAYFTCFWMLVAYPLLLFFPAALVSVSFKHSLTIWFVALLAAIFIRILNYYLMYAGLRKVEVSIAGIIFLLEPIVSIVLAYIIFAEGLTIFTAIGGVLIIIANLFVIPKKKQEQLPYQY